MANGKKGDNPLTDILYWKTTRFSETADALIAEIVKLGGQAELERTFNLFAPPALPDFERSLREIRDQLLRDRRERGWEV